MRPGGVCTPVERPAKGVCTHVRGELIKTSVANNLSRKTGWTQVSQQIYVSTHGMDRTIESKLPQGITCFIYFVKYELTTTTALTEYQD